MRKLSALTSCCDEMSQIDGAGFHGVGAARGFEREQRDLLDQQVGHTSLRRNVADDLMSARDPG
jgi:hypothetical protein